eukprot:scaffold5381_cov150-Skeletonema_menzelii.AAC.10
MSPLSIIITAASAAILLHASAAALINDDSGTSNAWKEIHKPRHAPTRPAEAPDVEYENHPFDQYRHLYDGTHILDRKRRLQKNDALRSQKIRWLNNEEDEDVPSDNDGEETTKTTESSPPSPTYTTTTLDPTTDSLYQPLRIQFDVSNLIQVMELARSSGNTLVMTKLQLLIYEVLPMTAQVWGDTLRVIPVKGGIYPLAARGSSVEAWVPNDTQDGGDEGGMEQQDTSSSSSSSGNKDGTATASVLYDDPVRIFYCPDATTSGISGGADLLIYATVNRHCGGQIDFSPTNRNNNRRMKSGTHPQQAGGAGSTLASALSCQRDQYDRPITGSIDFCLSGMDGTTRVDVDEAIAQKEAKGFGPSPNDNGENVIVGSTGASMKWNGWFGKSMDLESPLESNVDVVQYSAGVAIHEIGHVLGVSSDSLSYFRHPFTGYPLTPRPFTLSSATCVSGEEKNIVGIPSNTVMKGGINKATGARLENQPTGPDCFGSHFDERYFFTDIMGAVFSPAVNVLSPLVLAYLEDSGWYRANYQSNYVHIGTFGHGAGCAFLEDNCIDSDGNVPEAMEGNFCNSTRGGSINVANSRSQKCDPTHTQKAYCDWAETGQEPDPEFVQYVDDNPNLRPYTFTAADYCPIAHLSQNSCLEKGGRATSEQLLVGQYYGPDSRCVETDGSRSYSLCLQTICNQDLGQVEIIAGDQRRICEYDGQVHTVYNDGDDDDDDDDVSGPVRIKCPKAAMICPELFCPANCAGRGECVYNSDTAGQPLAKCVCDSEEDTTGGCFRTPLRFPESYGPYLAQTNRANKAVFLAIVGSLVIGLAILYMVLRQWKARQNVFM